MRVDQDREVTFRGSFRLGHPAHPEPRVADQLAIKKRCDLGCSPTKHGKLST